MSQPDRNYISYSDQAGVLLQDFNIEPPDPEYDDTLKLSCCSASTIRRGVVVGGRENAIDLNRMCKFVSISDVTLQGGRQASIVVKGGCEAIYFRDILIIPDKHSWCDVLWDDWSDQSRAPSYGVLDNMHRDDGKPVRLVFGRFRRPVILGGNVKILWIQTIGLHAYNLGKGLLRTLKLL